MLLAAALGLFIGVALGLFGGGGSVLAVPVLAGIVGLGAHEATTTSLLVVSAAALAGGVVQARGSRVCWPQVAAFAPGAVGGALAGAVLNQAVGSRLLLALFAGLMAVAAIFTWRRARSEQTEEADAACPPLRPARTFGAGLLVGVLTGFFGVGGGFLVVPLLALGLRFPLRQAIGTSLVIVAFVSMVALLAHLLAGSPIDLPVGGAMGAACAAGAVGGAFFSERLPRRQLATGFAVLLGAVAAAVAAGAAAG